MDTISSDQLRSLCQKSINGQIVTDASCLVPISDNLNLSEGVTSYEQAAFAIIRRLYPEIPADILALSLKPQRQIIVEVPLQLDNGNITSFTGYRVQYNNRRGPFKGGLRFHPLVDLEEATTLARQMAQKTALANIPLGGAKGGISCDPKRLSQRELQQLTRNFVNAIAADIGPDKDIPAPDVNTTPQVMGWFFDAYSKLHGELPAVVTGKPIELFGSLGRSEATGRGVMYATRLAAKSINFDLAKAKIIVQGFGNVGYWVAKLLSEECGATIVGLSTSAGGIYAEDGINVEEAQAYYRINKSLNGFAGAKVCTNSELLCLPCDVLVPAALGKVITVDVASKLQAKIVVEGANDCTLPEAELVLQSRGIVAVPDILANCGGVIVSYFEWVQNRTEQYWTLESVQTSLEKIITAAYANAANLSARASISLRLSAYVIAHKRIADATIARGVG